MKLTFILFIVVSTLLGVDTTLLNLQNKALDKNIDKSKQWKKLLHINKNSSISEIKDKRFFFSKKNDDAKLELLKTIEVFYNNKILESNESSICKFAARYKYLDEELSLSKYVKVVNCKKRDDFLKKLDAKSLSIVFSSAYLNSPSSQAGHTFLKINNSKSDVSSYSINYGAHTQNENIISYVYKGLFGGYDGTFDIIKYSKKIEEYVGGEQRDLYQFKLKIDQKDLKFILLHLYEIYDIPKPYMFVNKNCSYQILWFIQLTNDDLYLTDKFSFEVAPIETLKLLENYGLLELEDFRYSLQDKIEYTYDKLTQFEKRVLKSEDFFEEYKKNQNSIKNKALLLDIKIWLHRYNYLKKLIDKKSYIKDYIPLLRLRAKIKEKTIKVKIKLDDILSIHKLKKIKIGFNRSEDSNALQLSYKSAYHNITDFESNLDSGYIDYFGFDYIINDKNSYLKRFNLLDIRSYGRSSVLFPKLSWSILLNYEDMFIEEDIKYLNIKLGVGKSYQLHNNIKYYFMLSPIVALNKLEKHAYQSEIGLIYLNKMFKYGLEYNYRKEDISYHHIYKSFLTIPLNIDNSITLMYEKMQKESYSILYNYYF